MTKFLRLTEAAADGAAKPILINAAHILHIQLGSRSKDTYIRFKDDGFLFVKESFEQIAGMLDDTVRVEPILYSIDGKQPYTGAK